MFPYSAETLQRLKEAGWYEGRQIDPEPFVTSLTERGFEVNEAAIRFFAEFGGLSFHHPFTEPKNDRWDASFDVRRIPAIVANVTQCADWLHKPLCLVGECYDEEIKLLMDEAGIVYGRGESWFAKYGASGADAIECLCIDRKPEEMRIWEWPENKAKYEARRAAIQATYVTDDWVKESQDRIDKEVTEYMASKASAQKNE